MSDAVTMATAAMELVGASFRLHGRDFRQGVDCVGVLVHSLGAVGRVPEIPVGYSLRRTSIDDFVTAAGHVGLLPAGGTLEPGDLLVARVGPAQFHAGVVGLSGAVVHAHAGLGRVVLSPAPLPWPLEHHWRLPTS